jgi:hypothetical protein
MAYVTMNDLEGLVFRTVEQVDCGNGDELHFTTLDGQLYSMFHDQDCCEDVHLDDIVGDLQDLINTPILSARESADSDMVDAQRSIMDGEDFVMHKLSTFDEQVTPQSNDSETWTFYLFRTIKGSVTLRWHGSSNGYYSESVAIHKE